MNIGPIKVSEALWRTNPDDFIAKRIGMPAPEGSSNDVSVSISDEARALAELGDIVANVDSGSMSSMLTNQEKAEFNRISEHYGGKMDDQVGELSLNLAMDKLMAQLSDTPTPKLTKEYLLQKQNESGSVGTLGSRLEYGFLTDLLNNIGDIV